MWKMLVAFIIFAVIALTVVFKMGDKADLAGETAGHAEEHKPASTTPPAATTAGDNAASAAPAAAPAEEKK